MTLLSSLKTVLALLLLCVAVVAACVPAFGQAETAATNTAATNTTSGSGDDAMSVPPPVSGQSYPTEFAEDPQENYWRGGFTFSSGYSSDITGGTKPIGDENYSFWGDIAVDRVTTQSHLVLNYSPGFTVYQHTSGYDQSNQNLTLDLQYRISPAINVNVHEGLQQASSVFDQPNPLLATPVSGSVPTTGASVIAPLADQINNATTAQVTYQAGESTMLGISGNFGSLHYLNLDQATGLYNSRSAGASAFYSRQLGEKYYAGVNFQYVNFLSYQTNSPSTQGETESLFAFLSIYLKPRLSVSISAGPQHYSAMQLPFPTAASWSPLLAVSTGWQGERATVAASYSHIVGGAGGLSGVFESSTVGTSAKFKLSRNWNAGVGAAYANNKSLTPLFLSSYGGRTWLGTVSAQRNLGEHANLQFGYSWTNQTYQQIVALASSPNVNRVFFSLNYQFTRPLHR
jgi:hypothetical protein